MKKENYGLHWFRRDLRVAGNNGLLKNWKKNDGRVVGVFCFDKKFLGREDFSYNRFQFFINTLYELQKELRRKGSDLLFLDVGPSEAFPNLLDQLEEQYGALPTTVSWGNDYEPFSRERDKKMKTLFENRGMEVLIERDHLLIEPHELSKKTGDGPYQVYSPFGRQWLEIFRSKEIQSRMNQQESALKYLKKINEDEKLFRLTWNQLFDDKKDYQNILKEYKEENEKSVDIDIPPAGTEAALNALKDFKKKIDEYGDSRDIPSLQGTSRFSMFLKNGSLTVPLIIKYFDLKPYSKKKSNRDKFFSELIWREFYYHILYHFPRVENEAFLEEYKKIKWINNKNHFQAWKDGLTGYPIVDAGMRELKETGWMHNRVRMIVASFLTKDLLIDWRWGEKYFMEKLLDGDLAPNNGGWQWAASTGCDPQPYFRIFNPWLQGKKFDPEAVYMKKYLPELKELDPADFHKPIEHKSYPSPIVDHKERRDMALDRYKEAKG